MRRSAKISECGRYRYWLKRTWSAPLRLSRCKANLIPDHRTVTFVMLNPSKADARKDDNTIRRCVGFAKAWGYSGIVVRNLFALRATDPKELLTADDPVGPEGDRELLLSVAGTVDLLIVAWGTGVPFGRDRHAMDLFTSRGFARPHCLGVTKDGSPRHPRCVRKDAKPVPFPAG